MSSPLSFPGFCSQRTESEYRPSCCSLGAAGAISRPLLAFRCVCWPPNGKDVLPGRLMRCWTPYTASCLYREHLGRPEPDQAGQRSQSSISTKVCPFKTFRTQRHKLPHFIKWRQDRMWAQTTHSLSLSLRTRKLLFVFYTPSLPGCHFYTFIKHEVLFISWKCNRDESCDCLSWLPYRWTRNTSDILTPACLLITKVESIGDYFMSLLSFDSSEVSLLSHFVPPRVQNSRFSNVISWKDGASVWFC